MDQNEMRNLDRWPSIYCSYQDSIHLANRFHSRKVLNISQSETLIICCSHVFKQRGTKWAFLLISSRSVNKHGHHRRFLFLTDWCLKLFCSKTDGTNEPNLGRKHLWKIICTDCAFRLDLLTNVAATGSSCVRLADFWKKYSLLKLLKLNELKFGRKHMWKILYKECSFRSSLFKNMAATDD
jgi:hypothetical protein